MLPELLAPLAAQPGRSGICTDFDGTLSPIVAEADDARPAPGAVEVLDALARRFALVAVVSGRPVSFLEAQMPSGVRLSGLYGLEESVDGRREEVPGVSEWRDVVEQAAQRAEAAGLPGTSVERKGLSLTLHFRTHPEDEPRIRSWAATEAEATGLDVREAKRSIELHPPVATDKGTVIEALAADLGAVCYLADDLGDLPGYDGLDRLAEAGVHTVRIAVLGPETPAALTDRADVAVDGPAGAVALLEELAQASTAAT
ncbi:MAG: trehalose-phosphatase [Acidimicrobiia bacterium]|nr:trehalose-phosphatase [Acidimicrobiia bacterium]